MEDMHCFTTKNNLYAAKGRGGVYSKRRPVGKKREMVLQQQPEREREAERQRKGQYQLTDVIRNEGNMANTTSLSLSHANT